MGQVHYNDTQLGQVVSLAHHVMLVERASPAYLEHRLEVSEKGKNYPSFTYQSFRYKVRQVIGSEAEQSLEGKVIEVDPPNLESDYAMHRHYYIEGMHVSPIYDRLSGFEPEEGVSEFIILVTTHGKKFALVMDGAEISMSYLEDIRRAIDQKEDLPQPQPVSLDP